MTNFNSFAGYLKKRALKSKTGTKNLEMTSKGKQNYTRNFFGATPNRLIVLLVVVW